jgi:hypothetical protein
MVPLNPWILYSDILLHHTKSKLIECVCIGQSANCVYAVFDEHEEIRTLNEQYTEDRNTKKRKHFWSR